MIETLRSLARAAGHADLPIPPRPHGTALSYDGVRPPRRQGGWSTSGTSGNAEMGPALGKLRNNAEDLARNNAFAAKAVRRWCRRVVGYGITPQADTGSDAIDAVIDAYWKKWERACCSDSRLNIYACQRQIVRTAFTRGECLIRLWDRFMDDGFPVPFQIQVIEPDYLDTNKTGVINGANGYTAYVIQGVQYDLIGRVIGYWLFGNHPGDVLPTSFSSLTSKFVPAQAVIHHVPLERPGDARGVSRFAPVISKMRDLDEVGDAKIVKTKAEACVAMFVEQPEGPEGPTLGPVTDVDGRRVEELAPGMVVYGQAGQKPEFLEPTSSADFVPYKKSELKEIAAGLDLPYVVIGEDISDVNYSSFRGGAIDERDAVDEYRWLWFIPQVMDAIWPRFIDKLFAMGVIPERNYGVKWNPPPFDLLDRAAEAEADRAELQIGKKTWPQLVGAQGNDPEKQIQEIEKWKSRLDAAGVTYAKSTSESSADSGGNDGGKDQAQ